MNGLLEYFFRYETEISPAESWQLYGPTHLGALALMAVCGAFICYRYCRGTAAVRGHWRKGLAWAMIGLELFKDLELIVTGYFNVSYLPLHMCGISLFICLADAYCPTDAGRQLLYALGMPGAMAALLFADWTIYPPGNFRFWQSFLTHMFIVVYVLMQMKAGELRPNPKTVWKCAVFLFIVVPPIYALNKYWNVNFMFLNTPSPGSPLEPFAVWFGNPGYLIPFILLLFIVWVLMYFPFSNGAQKLKNKFLALLRKK